LKSRGRRKAILKVSPRETPWAARMSSEKKNYEQICLEIFKKDTFSSVFHSLPCRKEIIFSACGKGVDKLF